MVDQVLNSLTPLEAIVIFGGIPLLIIVAVTLAVYVPTRRRRRQRLRRAAAAKIAATQETPVEGTDDAASQPADRVDGTSG